MLVGMEKFALKTDCTRPFLPYFGVAVGVNCEGDLCGVCGRQGE